MPIYEYRCIDCGTSFEVLTSISDARKTPACPECASENTQKKISTFAPSSLSSSGGGQFSSGPSCGSKGSFS